MRAIADDSFKAIEMRRPDMMVFYLNQQRVALRDPDPRTLLVDYLRSPAVGLTGTKKSCGQGGCGACAVVVSSYDAERGEVVHRSRNACLVLLCALDGTSVTTVEGLGDSRSGLSPIQHRIAAENGSQCGFCTPGFVTTMTAFLAQRGDREVRAAEIERQLDGNLCRCTGYRPILHAMKHFACDWGPEQRDSCMDCVTSASCSARPGPVSIPFPDELRCPPRVVRFERDGYVYCRPARLERVLALLRLREEGIDVRLAAGHTAHGIDPSDVPGRFTLDLAGIAELRRVTWREDGLELGAGVTYAALLEALEEAEAGVAPEEAEPGLPSAARPGLRALRTLAGRTAGSIVRNAATVGGNLILTLNHACRGLRFPSDLFTGLCGLGATATLRCPRWRAPRTMPLLELADAWQSSPDMRTQALLVSMFIPYTAEGERVEAFKTAIRPENALAILNGCFRAQMDHGRICRARVVLGGIATFPFQARRLEAFLAGRCVDDSTLAGALEQLGIDLDEAMDRAEAMLKAQPYDGVTPAYRRQLAEGYVVRFMRGLLTGEGPDRPASESLPATVETTVSRGTQEYRRAQEHYPARQPMIRTTAFLQATGELRYVQDLPLPEHGLHGAFVLSSRALVDFSYRLPEGAGDAPVAIDALIAVLRARFPEVVDLITARDVPAGGRNRQGLVGDEPLFAEGLVTCAGQVIGLVLAQSERTALEAAGFVRERCIVYRSASQASPILSIEEALEQDSTFADPGAPPSDELGPAWVHLWQVTRPGSERAWSGGDEAPGKRASSTTLHESAPEVQRRPEEGTDTILEGLRCRIVHGRQRTGGQLHFYLETQTCLVEPDGTGGLVVYPSSQSPNDIHQGVVTTLGIPHHAVTVRIRPVGGSYGGKTVRAPFVASPAALAAWKHHRPVRVALPRSIDSAMTGGRHPFLGDYAVAIADGSDDPSSRGRLLGMDTRFWSDGGHTLDCSFVVMTSAQLQSDNAYFVPHYHTQGEVCRTHKASNTAFRSFGAIQTILIQEEAIEAAAHALGMRPEAVRERNLYRPEQCTPYGQRLEHCYLRGVWDYLKERCCFEARVTEVERFNATHRWRKRGISMIPVKYGLGFNVGTFEQAGVLIEVYSGDGSVLIRHGGVEVGQGILTKLAQVASETLELPVELIRVGEPDTSIIPNPTSTGASTATAFNGGAVREACLQLKDRLERFCREQRDLHGAEWCQEKRIDYWNHPAGWRTVVAGSDGRAQPLWSHIVAFAYWHRINLSVQVRFCQPGDHHPLEGLTFKERSHTINPFLGFTYSAACTEAEIDVLTGETVILRCDIVQDVGRSLNPALDIGQIEGAFVQGLGYVLVEEVLHQAHGVGRSALVTDNTCSYKVPSRATIPRELNVMLYPWGEGAEVPEDPRMPMSAKHMGEPPLVLAATAFFAVKHAILAARRDQNRAEWFELEAPATVQRVREAVLATAKDLGCRSG